MSYDLTLFRCPLGVAPELAVERLESGSVSEENFEQLEQTAAWLQARVPTLARSSAGDVAFIELDQHELDVQVILSGRSIDITLPYFRDGAREMLTCVRRCVAALSERGYTAWDPQLGRVVTPDDLDRMLSKYREADSVLPELRQRQDKPWWKFWG